MNQLQDPSSARRCIAEGTQRRFHDDQDVDRHLIDLLPQQIDFKFGAEGSSRDSMCTIEYIEGQFLLGPEG